MAKFFVSQQRGNDTNVGTESAPLRTLTAARGRLTSGGSDIIIVGPGVYREEILWSTSGSRLGPHQVIADWHGSLLSQDTPGIVRITGANANEVGTRNTVFTLQASHIVFDRFILDGVLNGSGNAPVVFNALISHNMVKFSRCHVDSWMNPSGNFGSTPLQAVAGHWLGIEFDSTSFGITGGGKAIIYINGANFEATFSNSILPGFFTENPEGNIFAIDAGKAILNVENCYLGPPREGSAIFRDNGLPLVATIQNCDIVLSPTSGLEYSGNEVSTRRSHNRYYGPGNAGTLREGETQDGTLPLPFAFERFGLYGARVFGIDQGALKSSAQDISGHPRTMGTTTDIGVTEQNPYPFRDRTIFRTSAPSSRLGGNQQLWSAGAGIQDFSVALSSGVPSTGFVYIRKNSAYGSVNLPGIQHLGHLGLPSSGLVTMPDVNDAFQLASVSVTPFMDTVVTFRIQARSTLISSVAWFDDFSVI